MERMVTLRNDDSIRALPGDWIISREQQILDVVPDPAFLARYDPADETSLQVMGDARGRLERTLGLGSTETVEHLVTAVERMARLVIGDVQIDFTPGQWEHLAHRAQKMGLTVDALVRRIVDKITSDIWNV